MKVEVKIDYNESHTYSHSIYKNGELVSLLVYDSVSRAIASAQDLRRNMLKSNINVTIDLSDIALLHARHGISSQVA